MAYHDQAFATRDAMLCGRLHTHLPGWAEANAAFMAGGGYSISKRIPNVKQVSVGQSPSGVHMAPVLCLFQAC